MKDFAAALLVLLFLAGFVVVEAQIQGTYCAPHSLCSWARQRFPFRLP